MTTLNNVVLFVLVLFVLSFGSVGCTVDTGGGGSPTSPTPAADPDPAHAPSGDGGFRFKNGELPVSTGMDNLSVYGRGSVGTTNDVEVCVWDTEAEDGDIINIWVAGYSLVIDDNPNILLLNESKCWRFTMQTGYYYPIRILAVTEGNPPNTGAVSANVNDYTSIATQEWDVPLRTNAEASLALWVP